MRIFRWRILRLQFCQLLFHPSFAVLIGGCAGVQSNGGLDFDGADGACPGAATQSCSGRKKRRGGGLPRRPARPRSSRADASSLKLRANRRNA
jgi:hypothetical protein